MKSYSVLITGCSSGIGLSTAKLLHAKGWTIYATARKKDDLEMLKSLNFNPIFLDLNKSESIINCVNEIIQISNGNLDALINNAGFGIPGAIEDLSSQSIKNQFEVNVFGAIDLTNRLIPIMKKKSRATIIYVSSLVGRLSLPYMGIYSASKFAIESIADAQRIELSDTSIKVVLIEPGPIRTKFSSNCAFYGEEYLVNKESRFKDLYKNYFKLRREGKLPEDRFRLSADVVAKKIYHALLSNKPKIRYKITIPTYVTDILVRFFPTRFVDAIIKKQVNKRFFG